MHTINNHNDGSNKQLHRTIVTGDGGSSNGSDGGEDEETIMNRILTTSKVLTLKQNISIEKNTNKIIYIEHYLEITMKNMEEVATAEVRKKKNNNQKKIFFFQAIPIDMEKKSS